MKSDYERLIELAAETDTPSTPEKVKELNVLLSQQSIDSIEKEHSPLLDDLISILSNTNNLCVESRDSIIALQDAISHQIGIRKQAAVHLTSQSTRTQQSCAGV